MSCFDAVAMEEMFMTMLNTKKRRQEKKDGKRSTEKKEKSIKLTIMRFQRVSVQKL